MEKAIRDKIVTQQREQQNSDKMKQKRDNSDDEDDFDLDEDDLRLFAKMKEVIYQFYIRSHILRKDLGILCVKITFNKKKKAKCSNKENIGKSRKMNF